MSFYSIQKVPRLRLTIDSKKEGFATSSTPCTLLELLFFFFYCQCVCVLFFFCVWLFVCLSFAVYMFNGFSRWIKSGCFTLFFFCVVVLLLINRAKKKKEWTKTLFFVFFLRHFLPSSRIGENKIMANKEGKNKLTRECAGITGTIKKKTIKNQKKRKRSELFSAHRSHHSSEASHSVGIRITSNDCFCKSFDHTSLKAI